MSEREWDPDPGTDVGDDGDLPDDPLIEGDEGGFSEDVDLGDEDLEDEEER